MMRPFRPLLTLAALLVFASFSPACSSDGAAFLPATNGSGGTTSVGGGGIATGGGGTTVSGTGASGPRTITETVCTTVKVPATDCEDVAPEQGNTCAEWKEWGQCGLDWFETNGYCQSTCGSCEGATEKEVCEEVTRVIDDSGTTNTGTDRYTDPDAKVDPVSGGQEGWASRYWDCCKPHCAWKENAPASGPTKMCTISNQPLSDPDAQSGCNGGPAYTCYSMAPWAVSETLAYGYAATPVSNSCGKCYQLDFTGQGQHNAADPGSKTLAGKSMIVQATNIGHDVGGGQFDLLIPGGGVGAFDGCTKQWGTSNLGETYGGFLASCGGSVSCLKDKCNQVFADKADLRAGCLFHAEWMGGADNPKVRYTEVDCPAELEQVSGMSL